MPEHDDLPSDETPSQDRGSRRNRRGAGRPTEPPAAAPEGDDPAAEPLPDKVWSFPYLVRLEALAALVVLVLLTVWSIVIDAPLEQAANPTLTPNPAKAPWYFVGLQELLVYFDPWLAGVVIPGLILVGLMAIPYLDTNPGGNGFYTFSQRRFAISTFLFGFLALWIVPIVVGVFFRGPGWGWFWPWEPWDAHAAGSAETVDLPVALGFGEAAAQTLVGLLVVALWYGLGVAFWFWRRHSPALRQLGRTRFAITAFLFISMLGIPAKILLRLVFDIKYVLVTPWFNL